MSILAPDFSADLQKDKVVAVVTNVYFWVPGRAGLGSRRGGSQYNPYNIIFGNDHLYGQNLARTGAKVMTSIGGISSNEVPFELNLFNNYIASGKLTKDCSNLADGIDIKIDYGKVKEVLFNPAYKYKEYKAGAGPKEVLLGPTLDLSFSTIEFRMGGMGLLGYGNIIFIVKDALLYKIRECLATTGLAPKIKE